MSEDQINTSDVFAFRYGREVRRMLGSLGENIVGQFNDYAGRLAGQYVVPTVEITREPGTTNLKAVIDGTTVMTPYVDVLMRAAARPFEQRSGQKFEIVGLEGLHA